MGSKYTKRYSDEYKRDAIELVRSSGRTVTAVARELGISSESLRGWVKKASAARDSGSGPGAVRAADGTEAAAEADRRAGEDDRDPEKSGLSLALSRGRASGG
ncbi:transposase [Streptomyces sp. V4I23]|uniref:transposase n=1 Tax=Streptomyces sp. V4I23 TaxID=3042282 RepID=UPI00278363BD|nr:transposase [Streptomyces sp. V4I23]MDQ1005887.1 transposase [Streptomyces sp. V4I23]